MKFFDRISQFCVLLGCLLSLSAYADTTIVIIRHGEKPTQGLGQLSCQGLNRSLALPHVLLSKYAIPVAIYAPNPSVKKMDKGGEYAYIRPLATIEPLAIRAGLPVNVDFGMQDIPKLSDTLLARINGVQIVSWEHHLAQKLASNLLLTLGGNPQEIPTWSDTDFDSIYVIRVSGIGQDRHAIFTHDIEGLNDLPKTCD